MIASQVPSTIAGAETAGSRAVAAAVGDEVALLTLDDRGMICDCNGAGEALFRYRRSELVWRHVSMLLPQFEEMASMENGQPNSLLSYLCHIGLQFHAVTQDGRNFASELFLNCLDSAGHGRLSLIVRPAAEAPGDGG